MVEMDVIFDKIVEDDQKLSPEEQMFEAVKTNDFDWLKKILKASDDVEELTIIC